MKYRYRMSQEYLGYIYESAKARIEAHRDIADRHRASIQSCTHYKSEKDALKAAIALMKSDEYSDCQIWAKIEKVAEFYRIVNWWLVTDDCKLKQSAEYIGMALMYDSTKLQKIIDNRKLVSLQQENRR